MVEVEVIKSSRQFLFIMYLWVVSAIFLFTAILWGDFFERNNLNQFEFQKYTFLCFALLTVVQRVMKRYVVIGNAILKNDYCEIQIADERIKLPTKEIDIDISSYKGEPIIGIRNLYLHFWESGDGNYIRFDQFGQRRTIEFKVDNQLAKEEINKIKLNTIRR